MKNPGISVIVPTFNDQPALLLCIEALLKQDYEGPLEIIVVDNCSKTQPTVPKGVVCLTETKPGSYNCRNRGMRAARHDIFAFTDADCLPHSQWLSKGSEAVMRLKGPGLIGGQIFTTVTNIDRPSVTELFEAAIAFPQERYINEGRYAATANMLTTRVTMETIGCFNGCLLSGGDKDWGRRAATAGFELIYAPDAAVDHPARATHRELRSKIRRLTGGERDSKPGWQNALHFALRHLVPPRNRIRAVMKIKGLPLYCRLAVAGYAILINWIYALERISLQVRGTSSLR